MYYAPLQSFLVFAQVFGLSAAVAVFLDIGIRVYMFFVGRMLTILTT